MAKNEFSKQEEQVNLLIEKIRKMVDNHLTYKGTGNLIDRIIQMKETASSDESVKEFISFGTGLKKDDPAIDLIFSEVIEKPFQNTYQPFNNDVLKDLKKDLEKE